MKRLFIINGLILSTLTLSAQNTVTNLNSNINIQQSVNYTNNIDVVQVQSNNRGRSSALSNFRSNTNDNVQTASLPKQQKVNTNKKTPVQNNLGNVYDNNVGNLSNPQVNTNIVVVNDINLNPSVNVSDHNSNKIIVNKPVIVEESHGSDFKQIGLSGRDYSNGGKLKKGQKNIPKPEKTKQPRHKPKLKNLKVKKTKHHTSKCATW